MQESSLSAELIKSQILSNYFGYLKLFTPHQSNFLSDLYKRYECLDSANIVLFFAKKTHQAILRKKEYDLNYDLSFEKFWDNHNEVVIENSTIIDIAKSSSLPKETARRKLVELIKKKILEIESQFKENIDLSDEVINYIANESKTNVRELIGILNRVIAFSRVHNKILSVSDCKNILKDLFSQAKVITIDKIQNVVSNYFNIPLNDMLSQRRSRPLARPRQIAMFLAKKMTTRSLPEIGRRFANRDHTTVIHAVKTIVRLSEQDDEMKNNVNQIKSLLLEQ